MCCCCCCLVVVGFRHIMRWLNPDKQCSQLLAGAHVCLLCLAGSTKPAQHRGLLSWCLLDAMFSACQKDWKVVCGCAGVCVRCVVVRPVAGALMLTVGVVCCLLPVGLCCGCGCQCLPLQPPTVLTRNWVCGVQYFSVCVLLVEATQHLECAFSVKMMCHSSCNITPTTSRLPKARLQPLFVVPSSEAPLVGACVTAHPLRNNNRVAAAAGSVCTSCIAILAPPL